MYRVSRARHRVLGERCCVTLRVAARPKYTHAAMPIYEYRCKKCEKRFEEYLSTSTKAAPPCPKCGSTDVARLVSSFATEWRPSAINWHRAP
jgi:putative FmdB family regulatory protein